MGCVGTKRKDDGQKKTSPPALETKTVGKPMGEIKGLGNFHDDGVSTIKHK